MSRTASVWKGAKLKGLFYQKIYIPHSKSEIMLWIMFLFTFKGIVIINATIMSRALQLCNCVKSILWNKSYSDPAWPLWLLFQVWLIGMCFLLCGAFQWPQWPRSNCWPQNPLWPRTLTTTPEETYTHHMHKLHWGENWPPQYVTMCNQHFSVKLWTEIS